MTNHTNAAHKGDYAALAALIRTVPIGPFGPNAKALINMGQTTFLTPTEAEALADALIGAGWISPSQAADRIAEEKRKVVGRMHERRATCTGCGGILGTTAGGLKACDTKACPGHLPHLRPEAERPR